MIIVRNILFIALAVLVQTSWIHKLQLLGVTPDIVLLLIAYIGIREGQISGTIYGFFSGLLLDFYDPHVLGINALANSVVGFAVGYTRVGVCAEDIRVQALILFAATLLHDAIYFTMFSISEPAKILPTFFRYGPASAFLTALFGTAVSALVSIRFENGIHLDARRLHG